MKAMPTSGTSQRGEVTRVDQVGARVGAHLRERRLRAGEHHGPIEPGQRNASALAV
jgi:hypothetical protein